HRLLYDWFLNALGVYHPQQIEFARLNVSYTVMSKRRLLELVEERHVNGWDDPRMPTITGLRRRGYTPESIRDFADRVGVAKRENVIGWRRSEEHTSELQSRVDLVCRLLLEKKKKKNKNKYKKQSKVFSESYKREIERTPFARYGTVLQRVLLKYVQRIGIRGTLISLLMLVC